MEVLLLNFLEMGGDDAVERDADGLPRAWPLLKVGDNVVTRSEGMPLNLRLTHDDLAAIVQYHDAKGVAALDGALKKLKKSKLRTGTNSGGFTASRNGDGGNRLAAGEILPPFCVLRGLWRDGTG